MSSQKPSPKAAAHAERAERLAAELRENLKRRKAQARARNTTGNPGASDNNNNNNYDGDKSE